MLADCGSSHCSVYNEKRVSVEGAEGEKKEYRVWNPFRWDLACTNSAIC